MHHAIGIDIGGGSTKIGLVSEAGKIIDRCRIKAIPDDNGDAIVQRIAAAVKGLISPGIAVKGIGIGYPGPIHAGNQSGGVGNVAGLIDYPLAMRLTETLGLSARLENDATAAALAEARFGAGRSARRLLMVTAGTGIGVAMIVDGQAMVTSGGCLGDAGHMIVNGASALRCRLGCTGCLEALASAEALDDLAASAAEYDPMGAIARQAVLNGTKSDAAVLIQCALSGDPKAQAMLSEAGRWIGRAVASWAHIFGPDTVVIGGGLGVAGDLFLGPLVSEARRCGLPNYMAELRIAPATMGNDAGIIGAAAQMLFARSAVSAQS